MAKKETIEKAEVENIKEDIKEKASDKPKGKIARRIRKGMNDKGQWEWETIYE